MGIFGEYCVGGGGEGSACGADVIYEKDMFSGISFRVFQGEKGLGIEESLFGGEVGLCAMGASGPEVGADRDAGDVADSEGDMFRLIIAS